MCNQLQVRTVRYTGELQQGDCCYAEKARRVQQQYCLSDFDLVYAYGDSLNDHAMLALADKKFISSRKFPIKLYF
ncbi:haloacid dehalogenase-like hydrolase [Acinetobacter sp. ANC 4633]|uniref:haloacid dehalogenase-like hydrolase n=1 Tax=Acinetobacter sp. ANC 4633 TaxID=2529845 RepID=UPI003A4D5177